MHIVMPIVMPTKYSMALSKRTGIYVIKIRKTRVTKLLPKQMSEIFPVTYPNYKAVLKLTKDNRYTVKPLI